MTFMHVICEYLRSVIYSFLYIFEVVDLQIRQRNVHKYNREQIRLLEFARELHCPIVGKVS